MCPGPSTAQLDEISALAVAEAVRPFSVHSDWPSSTAQSSDCLLQGFRGGDQWWHALGGLGE